jgi:Cu+-exporting ATPase
MSGVAYIQAMRHGKDSYLTKEVNDVARSLKVKPSISKLIDRIAVYFVPGIIAVAGISALGWFFFGPVPALPWIMKSVMSIFLCTCPCMLTLATPIAETVSNYAMVNNGIFVRDPSVIDDLAELDTIVFDKTGTLTMPTVLNMHANTKDFTEDDILQYVVSLENACIKLGHDHPIARSFLHKQTGFELLKCKNPKKDDQGVSGSVNGHDVLIGCHTHLSTRRVTNLRAFAAEEKKYAKQGLTTIYVAIDGKCVAVYGLKHEIQYGAREAIDKLKRMGINVFMLTGDKDKPSKSVAKDLGINQVMAERNSKEKEMFIRGLERSRKVAMVGDGVNDFAAIRKAHVGIAVGPWTPASSASHIAVHNLDLIPLILIARQTMRNIKQNLWWTGLYNSFSIAAASGVLYPMFGFVMSPVLASILMMTSSLIVVLNSSRLIHEIQYSLDKYHGRINKPRTYWQKFVDFFAVTGLVKTIGMLLGFKQPRPQQYKLNAPDAKFIKDKVKTESPEKPKLREAALPFDIPKGMMLRREPASVVLDDEQSNSLRI